MNNMPSFFQKIFGYTFQVKECGHRLQRKYYKNCTRFEKVSEGSLVLYNRQNRLYLVLDHRKKLFLNILADLKNNAVKLSNVNGARR